MTDITADTAEAVAETSGRGARQRRGIMLGLALALLCAAGGFAASYLGLLDRFGGAAKQGAGPDLPKGALPAFVPVPQLLVSIGPPGAGRHLRFAAEIEVSRNDASHVAALMPRVTDVLNGYLRAVEPALFDRPEALMLMRAQMLRRIRLVTGEALAADLLITEFVID